MPRSSQSRFTATALAASILVALVGAAPRIASADNSPDQHARGFSGSNLTGFSGSNLSGFSGSNLTGFSGSNLSGFSGNNLDGFSGSNLDGFSGSNLDGFSGSNLDGFSGSNLDGFSGSNLNGFSGSNLTGFSGSNLDGFSGSNLDGFSGSNLDGFSGSNLDGFSGSNLDGFSGSNLDGFSGSNLDGFSGSNLDGFSGSNLDGFSGSNLDGFSGSNLDGFSGSNLDRFSGSNLSQCRRSASAKFADAFSVAAMGAVDAIVADQEGTQIVVAGQGFAIPAQDVGLFQVGDYVVAASATSETSAVVYHVGLPYVPGVSPVRVKGPVIAVDLGKGALSIGALALDYTPQLATAPSLEPQVGDTAQVVGVQPAAHGAMVLSTCASGLLLERD